MTVLTFVLIAAGALVTSRDAGLAVPDWPLSFGTINPPRWYAIENVRTEHGHRVIAGCVALATVLMGLSIRKRAREPRDLLLRRLGALAVAAVLLQALLGGLRVLHLSIDLAMVHGCLGQVFLCIVVAIATLTSPRWEAAAQEPIEPRLAARALAAALPLAVLGQLVLGIVIRHGELAEGAVLASPLLFAHIGLALAVVAAALRLWTWLTADAALSHATRRAGLLVGLLLVQIVVGVGSLVVTYGMADDRQATFLESWIPTLHVVIGASVLATGVVVALHVRRRPASARVAVAAATSHASDPAMESA